MEYRILSATFLCPVDAQDDATPAVPSPGRVDFRHATFDELRLDCAGPQLHDLRDSVHRQTLIEDTTLGFGLAAQTVPAGTPLSLGPVAILQGHEQQFGVFFPWVYEGGIMREIGGRHTVLIVPGCSGSDEGQICWPAFRADAPYECLPGRAPMQAVTLDPQQGGTPCLAKGTLVLTSEGPRPVETLRPGALVHSRDHGAQRLRWIGTVVLDTHSLARQPQLRPVRISAGSLGAELPVQDVVVAPQQRVLVSSTAARTMFGASEILIAARQLVGMPGISAAADLTEVTYLQLLFDRHELILSNGAWTESFHADSQTIASLPRTARHEIMSIFPEWHDTTARGVATDRWAAALVARHLQDGRALLDTRDTR